MKHDPMQLVFYGLAFLALLYLAFPHIMECYESYARPWNTEHMTNADIKKKMSTFKVWEMFDETEVKTDKQLSEEVLPGETKTKLKPSVRKQSDKTPDVPAGPIGPSNKHVTEAAIEKPPETIMNSMEDVPTNTRIDKEIQKPSAPLSEKPPPRTVIKQKVNIIQPMNETSSKEGIWGPRAPKLDTTSSQPRPGETGREKHQSGVYPNIYGPELLKEPGKSMFEDSSSPAEINYRPVAEFPAGPLRPSPYLNDFSKILKT